MQIDFSTREGRRAQGALIQNAAEDAGLSLESLAREIGCSRALIYQYVSGATLAQPDRLQAIAMRTGKPLVYFFGGHAAPDNLHERIGNLQALLQAQLTPPDLHGALSSCEQLIALARQAGEARGEASARLRLVSILLQQGEAARALTVLEQSLPFLRQQDLDAHLRVAEQNRGHALLALGRVEEAEEAFGHVITQGDWGARWQGTVSLAAVAEHQGRYFRALELLDAALALAEAAPDLRAGQTLQLYVAGNLANVHLACGDHGTAAREADQARELAVQLANRDQYIEALLTLGVCQRWSGTLAQSRLTLESAARWARLAEDKGREALAWAEGAHTLVEAGRYDEARALGKAALQQGIATGTRRAELAAQLALAAAYNRSHLPQEARYHAGQAWEISVHLGQPHAQAVALVTLGDTHAARGDHAEACRAFEPARDLAESTGARLPAVQASLGLLRLGMPVDIDALLTEAEEVQTPLLLWPIRHARARKYEQDGARDRAESCYHDAISIITSLRQGLAGEPTGDTYLEDRRAWEPYLALAALYRAHGHEEAAAQVLAEADWPPLHALQEETV